MIGQSLFGSYTAGLLESYSRGQIESVYNARNTLAINEVLAKQAKSYGYSSSKQILQKEIDEWLKDTI